MQLSVINKSNTDRAVYAQYSFLVCIAVLISFSYLDYYKVGTLLVFFFCVSFLLKIRLVKKNMIMLMIFLILACGVGYLFNGRYLYLFSKCLHIFNIIVIFTILVTRPISTKSYIMLLSLHVVISCFAVPFIFTEQIPVDKGLMDLPRFAGYFTDANYFAFINFLFLISLERYLIRYITPKIFLISFILLSQSITVFSIVILYYSGILNRLARFRYMWFIVFVVFFSFLFYLAELIVISDDWQGKFIIMKLNSIFFRFESILRGVNLIMMEETSFFFGFGSGRSEELIGRVMHNSIAQTLFDHGAFGLLSIIVLLNFMQRQSSVPAFFLSVILFSLLFDPLWSYVFSILPVFGRATLQGGLSK